MNLLQGGILAWLLVASSMVVAGVDIQQQQIQFGKGESAAKITGKIKGDQIVDYQLRASAGQRMVVTFNPSHPAAYFNVLPQGSETALFIGSVAGNHFDSTLPDKGLYTIRVYLMRSAARRQETADYQLEVQVTAGLHTGTSPKAHSLLTGQQFNKTLTWQNIQFQVTSRNTNSGNEVQISPAGLAVDNSPVARTVAGNVTDAELADLNLDGSPEIYVYVRSAGDRPRGSLLAYAVNQRKSLSEIYLAPLSQNKLAAKGYRGQDQFAVIESVLAQRFPLYKDTDSDDKPTGGTRQLQYKLVAGEAGWVLQIDKVVEF